jgi:DNA-binding transcriptional LysR family regulator
MIDFRLIRQFSYFLAVADQGNFRRAATHLGISQPPLSTQIANLEKTLGMRLFERSRRGAKLTDGGTAILPAVRRLAEQAQRVQALVHEAREGRSEYLFVSGNPPAIFNVLPGLIRRAKRKFPNLSFSITEMTTAATLEALRSGNIDLGFARLDQDMGAIRVRPLETDTLVVALPFQHRLTRQAKINLRDLADEPMILFPRDISPDYHDTITNACRRAGFLPRVMHEVNTTLAQVAFVGCGIGVSLVSGGMARAGARDVVFRPLSKPVKLVTIAAVWNEEKSTPLIRSIIEMATLECRTTKSIPTFRLRGSIRLA